MQLTLEYVTRQQTKISCVSDIAYFLDHKVLNILEGRFKKNMFNSHLKLKFKIM